METHVMARFEAHPTGIAFISIAASEVERLNQECPGLIETFQNGGAVAHGDSKPLKVLLTPSWSAGHPVITLPCGGLAVEIDRSSVGLSPRSATAIEQLALSFTDNTVQLTEQNGSKRARPTATHTDIEAAILDAVQKYPMTEAALRFMIPDRHHPEIQEAVQALLSSRKIGYHGEVLVLTGAKSASAGAEDTIKAATAIPSLGSFNIPNSTKAASPKAAPTKADAPKRAAAKNVVERKNTDEPETVIPPVFGKIPQGAMVAVKKAVSRSGPEGIDIAGIASQTELDIELVKKCLDFHGWRHTVFKDETLYKDPSDEGRTDVFEMVNDFLFECGKPMSSAAIVKALDYFHPAWVHKTLDTMVRRNQVDFDGESYTFRMPERFKRSTGIHKVRELIETAANEGISIKEIGEHLPDLPFWLITTNVRRLAEQGRITYKEETCFWNPNAVAIHAPKARPSFRDEIREALRQAGPQGLTRDRVIEMFTQQPHAASPTKISIALNDLISRSEAVLRSKHYRFVEIAPLQLGLAESAETP